MIIKLLLIAGVAGAAVFALRSRTSSTNLAVKRCAAVLFAALAIVSVLFPGLVTWAAERVGVHRGTDLLLYVLVVTFLFTTIGLHQRLHQMEARLIRLTRELALRPTTDDEWHDRASARVGHR